MSIALFSQDVVLDCLIWVKDGGRTDLCILRVAYISYLTWNLGTCRHFSDTSTHSMEKWRHILECPSRREEKSCMKLIKNS